MVDPIAFTFLGIEIAKGCPNCPWKDRKSRTVPFEGSPLSRVMVVGRNPGRDEDRIGRPFVGRGGAALDRFLVASSVARSKIIITNTSKCYGAPTDIPPTEEVFDACEIFIQKELALFQPELIVTLGNDALRRLTGDSTSSLHHQEKGQIVTYRHLPNFKFFPISHPGYWVRRSTYLQDTILATVAANFKRVLKELNLLDLVRYEEEPLPGQLPT
jgi:uracil-DNA glycosylase family 4